MNRNGERVHGGRGFITEVAGRDRVKFFRRPVEQEGSLPTTDTAHIHFAASYSASQLGGTAASGRSRPATMNGSTRNRPHRLPRLQKSEAEEEAEKKLNERSRAAGTQTGYRENEAQTDPYSPNYFIPDDMPEPEILKLQGLKWKDGLPVGQEEVELIQRLRRRRAVEAQLPTGKDDASIEKRYAMLHQLEEEEWKDREEHVEKLQKRRLDKIEASLMEREAAREEANQRRLDGIKQQQMSTLRGKLTTLESRRMADSRRAVDQKLMQTSGSSPQGGSEQHRGGRADNGITYGSSTRKRDLIESYVKYGKEAAPPQLGNNAGTLQRVVNYDVRPAMLGNWDNVEEVDAERGVRIERVGVKTFDVPVKEAIKRLPTLYQRHEAERVLDSLEYAHNKIQEKDAAEETRQHVLDLYRATPKVQRPDTPVLELDGDDQEEVEEACILLQRLLRGRAVQNDYFEGKERCRGLIEELQAASNAKYAQRSLVAAKEREELIEKQEAMVQGVLHVAQGDIISDTLGYLFQELEREQDIQRLDALRVEAEAVRQDREVKEIERREEERVDRDREEVQYAAFVRSTDATIHCFLHDVFASAVDGTALAEAVMAERNRQAALPPPMDPPAQVDKENLVCDMLDGFVLPTVVDFIDLRGEELDKKAPAGAALDVARSLPPMNSPPNGDEEAPME